MSPEQEEWLTLVRNSSNLELPRVLKAGMDSVGPGHVKDTLRAGTERAMRSSAAYARRAAKQGSAVARYQQALALVSSMEEHSA